MPYYRQPSNDVLGTAETESTVADQVAPQIAPPSRTAERLASESRGFALNDGPGHAYNEDAFHYFLEIERKRSAASNRSFLLMLIDFDKHPRIDAVTANKLFSVLSLCLRETDFIGWYRVGRVAGAVLTQHGQTDGDAPSDVVGRRIDAALRHHLPSDLVLQLRARVYQVPPCPKSESK